MTVSTGTCGKGVSGSGDEAAADARTISVYIYFNDFVPGLVVPLEDASYIESGDFHDANR